ncbi:GumC family protein [Agrobacterium rosae]|uniref:Cryptic autophosphorylating protein tyrosine kinase Etk n=1 Tax=Agrobacterium rosae TaxID=1972867 RepID=A0A1R3TA24_9HYPH|nr:GumC family protein [Agrobacterium rosae]SCX06326.1 cryptic autophosphorylating protein tyrosine kinase Etk [Agrobacterium rosae]
MSNAADNSFGHRRAFYSGLIGLADIVFVLWQRRLWVLVVTVLCAALPYAGSFLIPNYYFVYTQILLDPDGNRVFTSDLRKVEEQPAVDGYVLSQQAVIVSDLVLRRVVESERLHDDPDFGAAAPHYPDQPRRITLAIEKLRDAVKLKRVGDSYIIEVKVTDTQPERATRITTQIADSYFQVQQKSSADMFRRTGNSLATQLDNLRVAVENADRAVNTYRSEHNITILDGQSDTAGQITALNSQISRLADQISEQQTISAELNKARTNLNYQPTVPDANLTRTIVQLRARYNESREEQNVLATSVGTRHPSFLKAAERSRAIAEILNGELRNNAQAAAQNVLKLKNQNAIISAQLNRLKSDLNENNTTMVTMRELERKLASERAVYEEFLLRTRQLSEQAGLTQEQPQVIGPASHPLRRAGPPRNMMAFIGGLTGLILVMAVVILRADLLSAAARKGMAA